MEERTTALRRSARDPAAFAEVYDEHARAMLVFFARRTFDAEVAADLAAETFAQAEAARARVSRALRGLTHQLSTEEIPS